MTRSLGKSGILKFGIGLIALTVAVVATSTGRLRTASNPTRSSGKLSRNAEAVPTAIAGIYGMNFKHMPELDTAYGYFVVLGLMTMFCLLLFVRFKKAKWL